MNAAALSVDITLEPADNERLAELCGEFDAHLRQLEQRLGVEINSRGNQFRIIGEAAVARRASQILEGLYSETGDGELTPEKVHLYLQEAGADHVQAVANRIRRLDQRPVDLEGRAVGVELLLHRASQLGLIGRDVALLPGIAREVELLWRRRRNRPQRLLHPHLPPDG